MTQRVSLGVLTAALLLGAAPAAAQSTRSPTPRESIARTMAPVRAALDALTATVSEREAVSDLLARAESAAAARVEAEHHRDPNAAASSGRRIALVIEALRARVAALRAEAQALEAEAACLAAEQALAVHQGALERASTRRLLADRPEVSASPLSAAPPPPPAAPTPPTAPTPPRATP